MPKRDHQAVDLVVVGAGAIGLACAWRAAQAGLTVTVLERDRPGAGASGVAAGMLAPVGEATWGEEGLLGLALHSHAAWPAFAAELAETSGADVGYLPLGALHVALDSDEAAELRRRHELMRSLDLDASVLSPSQARGLEPGLTPRCAGAVHAPHEAAVDPGALVSALAAAAERAGAEVIAGAEVAGAIGGPDRVEGVVTSDGTRYPAGNVLLASGSWAGAAEWVPPRARPPVRPVKGEILTLRAPADPPCERVVVTDRVYVVPRGDGRVIVGATVEERGFDLAVTAGGVHELLREAYRALPDIAELEFIGARSGLRPGTPDNAPLVGPTAVDGLFLATGHYRNGILLAPATATAVLVALTSDRPDPAMAAADPARFAATEAVPG